MLAARSRGKTGEKSRPQRKDVIFLRRNKLKDMLSVKMESPEEGGGL